MNIHTNIELSEILATFKKESPLEYEKMKRAIETAPSRVREEVQFPHRVSARTRENTRLWEAAGRHFATVYLPAIGRTRVYEVWEVGSTGRFSFDPEGKGFVCEVYGDRFADAVDFLHEKLIARVV